MDCSRCTITTIEACFEYLPGSTESHKELFERTYDLIQAAEPCANQIDACPQLQTIAQNAGAIAAEIVKRSK